MTSLHAPAQQGSYDFSKNTDKRTAFLARWGALKSIRSSWRVHWQDISRHLLPRSGRFFATDRNKSHKSKYNAIYDNTATAALRTLGAGMMAGASNPARPWFRLQTADPELNQYHPVRLWLDDVVERMERVFARSNTYRTLHQMYEELGAFGTSVSMILPDFKNVIHHYPIPCGEYCLQQDYQGRVVALYREFQKTVGEVVKEFGLESCSSQVRSSWTSRQHENPVLILQVIEPREDQQRDPHSKRSKDMPWKSVYIEIGGHADQLLRESGFKRFPVVAPRWTVTGNDTYGGSPGMEALGDIRQLQQEQLRKGQAIDYKVRPPLQVPTQLHKRESELFPGGLSYVSPGTTLPHDQVQAHGGIRSAFEVNLDLKDLLADILDVRTRINSSFYADLFLMLSQPPLQGKQMTYGEVAARHEEKLIALGPVLERLHNEQLNPTIDITYDAMNDAGLLPPAPEELQGQDLTVEFVSILAQAQRAVGSNATDRFVSSVLEVATVKPEVLDNVNFDKWANGFGSMLGVDTEILVPEDDVIALREARARAQAAEAQVNAEREQAKALKDVASVKTDESNVVADALTSGTPEELLA